MIAAFGVGRAEESALPPMPTVSLQVGAHVIRAEVVAVAADRARGLMFRKKLAPDAGMLFVHLTDDPRGVCMWMKNTPIPLSMAFLDAAGKVISIADMQPHSETAHCATGPARYVLEVNRGTFAAAGVTPGARIGGLPDAR